VALAILRKYDGTIDAQNAPGGGAVFTVTLPAVPPKPVPPPSASAISATAK
jgi:signal transduction histidine kinase